LTTLVLFWVLWIVIFSNFAKSDDPDSLLKAHHALAAARQHS